MRTKPFVRVRYEPTSSPEELTARMTQLSKMGDKAPVFLEAHPTLLTILTTLATLILTTLTTPVVITIDTPATCSVLALLTVLTLLTTLTRRPCTRARRR